MRTRESTLVLLDASFSVRRAPNALPPNARNNQLTSVQQLPRLRPQPQMQLAATLPRPLSLPLPWPSLRSAVNAMRLAKPGVAKITDRLLPLQSDGDHVFCFLVLAAFFSTFFSSSLCTSCQTLFASFFGLAR